MFDRLDRKVDVEVGPVQVVGALPLDVEDGAHRGLLKPGKCLEGNEQFTVVNHDPEPVLGNVGHFNLQECVYQALLMASACSSINVRALRGFSIAQTIILRHFNAGLQPEFRLAAVAVNVKKEWGDHRTSCNTTHEKPTGPIPH